MADELSNPNPVVYSTAAGRRRRPPAAPGAAAAGPVSAAAAAERAAAEDLSSAREPIDAAEIFDLIRDITDPEHPYSLEQLHVVSLEKIWVDDAAGSVRVEFTPTVEHCSMATLIGLTLRAALAAALPPRFRADVAIAAGAHASEAAVNKQLADKERVAAALENPNLVEMVNKCLAGADGAGAAAEGG